MATLPEEILDFIFAHLEPERIATPRGIRYDSDDHVQRKTLSSICRASRVCNRIAYPYLYRTIHLRSFSSRPRLLLRSLLTNPKFAKEVRQIKITGSYTWNKQRDKDLGRFFELGADEDLKPLATPFINSLQISAGMRKTILSGIGSKLEDAEIACVAAFCPFLEVLDLPVFEELHASSLMLMAEELYGSSRSYESTRTAILQGDIGEDLFPRTDTSGYPFSRIREVSLNRESVQEKRTFTSILPLLRLPKLETFRSCEVDIISDSTFSTMAEASSPLQHLSILRKRIEVDGRNLFQLLTGCSNLDTFVLYGVYKRYPESPYFDGIGRALNHMGGDGSGQTFRSNPNTLQHITLTSSSHFEDWTFNPLGDITNLRLLRVLSVPAIALFGQRPFQKPFGYRFLLHSIVDLLPKSLQHLYILAHTGRKIIGDFSPGILELWMDYRFEKLEEISFDRLAWTEKLFQDPMLNLSDSTPKRVILRRSV